MTSQPDSPPPTEALAEKRLREAVEAAEAQVKAERSKSEKPAPKLEPLWMVLFEAFLLFGLSGLQGAIARNLDRLHALGRPPEDLMDRLWYDARGIAWGFKAQFPVLWPVVILMLLAVVGVAFGIKDTKRRRRYFSLASALTVAVFAALIGAALYDLVAEKGLIA